MKQTVPYFITEVFGKDRYSGNQLATFFDFGRISDKEMQLIAKEINFSETTFITNSEMNNKGYDVRIFTPASEIDFAGHPTLGTAYIINQYLTQYKTKSILLNYRKSKVLVTDDNKYLWMKQNKPEFGKKIDLHLMTKMLNLDSSDFESNIPIQEVSTGLPFTIVALKNLKSLRKSSINIKVYNDFIRNYQGKGIAIFSKEPYFKNQDLSVRVFVNYLGVPEDPATGSAAGCIASYLLKYNVFNQNSIDITIGQGFEINRPSEIKVKAQLKNEIYDINVGGRVKEISKGEWEI